MSRNHTGERMAGGEKRRTEPDRRSPRLGVWYCSHQSSLGQTHVGYVQCEWRLTGTWKAQAWPTRSALVVLRKTLPLKKVEEVGQIFCCLENSKKHEWRFLPHCLYLKTTVTTTIVHPSLCSTYLAPLLLLLKYLLCLRSQMRWQFSSEESARSLPTTLTVPSPHPDLLQPNLRVASKQMEDPKVTPERGWHPML